MGSRLTGEAGKIGMASDIVTQQTKTEPARRRGSEAHLDGDDYFPTTENVNTMLDLLEGQGEDKALARHLALAIAESWVSGSASYTSKAVQTLMDWMATAEEYADPEGLEEIREARRSIERGEGIPWDSVKEQLGQ